MNGNSIFTAILKYAQALISGSFIPNSFDGKLCEEAEFRLKQYLNKEVQNITLTNSAVSSNLLALATISDYEFGEREARFGDEVITIAGFPQIINPIIQNGLMPVFVDVNLDTLLPNCGDIEEAITDRTTAIMLPHILGNPYDSAHIRDICDEYNLWMIEDCSTALGAMINCYDKAGSWGDFSTFSLEYLGAVATKSPMTKEILRQYKCCDGTTRIGYDVSASEIDAALGIRYLQKIDAANKIKQEKFELLYAELKQFDGYFIMPKSTEGAFPVWQGFPLVIKAYTTEFIREEIVGFLRAKQISIKTFIGTGLMQQPSYSNVGFRIHKDLFNSDIITSNGFWIEFDSYSDKNKIDCTVECFKEFIKGKCKKDA